VSLNLLMYRSKRQISDWVISSAGRAPPLQGGGRRFDPVITHHSLESYQGCRKIRYLEVGD
jgi:hypothetical protein